MNTQYIKGILLVAIGASSYGMVAVFIKQGVAAGFTTGELVFAQAFVGTLVIVLLNLLMRAKLSSKNEKVQTPTKKEILKLMIGGFPLALTSTFYYISLQYIPVSVCIVMLMQSVWIGVVIDLLVNKVKPSFNKIIAILIVLAGTVLATNVLKSDMNLDWRGVMWGFFAAISYSCTFLATNNVATGYKPLVRSMYMLFGLLIMASVIWGYSLSQKFDPSVLWTWGIVIAFFGTVLPPLLFTKGMPLIGVGLGGIVASMELPVSVIMAYLILHEQVDLSQWIGIILILFAVVLMNISFKKSEK